jgi:hypothetical protein
VIEDGILNRELVITGEALQPSDLIQTFLVRGNSSKICDVRWQMIP